MRPSSLALALLVVGAARAAAAAPADDQILRGPHPFLRDNELSFHGGYGAGFGDSFAGWKVAADYGYRLTGGLWLDLGVGFLSGGCRPRPPDAACARKGDAAEVLAGIKWKLRMNVPVVPYAKAVAGLVYLFPDAVRSAVGMSLRAGIGGKYFFYDWFGVGLEVTTTLGAAGYQAGSGLSSTLAGVDLVGGVELQF